MVMYFAAWSKDGSLWFGLAKCTPFVNGHPLYEPGEIWFEVADTSAEAIAKVQKSVFELDGRPVGSTLEDTYTP